VKVDVAGSTAHLTLEDYPDLLVVRTLPDYRFTGRNTVTCDHSDLAALGLAATTVTPTIETAPHLFDYQEWIVRRAIDRERFAIFADTGLGKTAMQLEWARLATEAHGGRTLIVAPLNVVHQTIDEAHRFYGDTLTVQDLTDRAAFDEWLTNGSGIGILNYEKFDSAGPGDRWGDGALPIDAVVLDESSMLKAFGTRKFAVMRAFDGCRYKLACSATPAPNQRTEFAQHAVFLGQVRATTEYLTAYFDNRDGDWQFKAHSHEAWVANLSSWAVFVRDPKRWGFADHLADMPPLMEHFHEVPLTDPQMVAARRYESGDQPSLFGATPGGVTSRTKMMQIAHGFLLDAGNIVERYPTHKPGWISDLVRGQHAEDQVIIWVTFDEEGDQLEVAIPGARHLSGRTSMAERTDTIDRFRAGDPSAPRVLILKPSMFGHGINLQSCAVQIFSTITDSFERYYQCVRRSHRYGQTRPVQVYVPLTQLDDAICQNVMEKQSTFLDDARTLEDAVVGKLRPADTSEVRIVNPTPQVEIDRTEGDGWTMVHADSLAHLPTLEPGSVKLAVFSPPFAALYAYSKALGDMGNVRGEDEFRLQWQWFAERLLPAMAPGRVVAIHCKEIIRFANTSGYRHCYDFPSDLREGMVAAGFHYQRRITIEKNPQLEATRNKETSLLHVTALRDAANSMPQTGEYLMVFTAPGANEVPVTHARDEHSFERHTAWMNSIWPEPAEPDADELDQWKAFVYPDGPLSTWPGIRETDVLNARVAKEKPEERHVCPLQLSLIERAVHLWSNPGELVLSPFGGIGSEGWASIGAGRRFYGIELKESYYQTACRFLTKRAAEVHGHRTIFDALAEASAS
jgi:hypothetical protein